MGKVGGVGNGIAGVLCVGGYVVVLVLVVCGDDVFDVEQRLRVIFISLSTRTSIVVVERVRGGGGLDFCFSLPNRDNQVI